jgi:SAM-dependent methyltransferase
MDGERLKAVVREKYGEIAHKSLAEINSATCCGTQCCSEPHDFTAFNDDYSSLSGYLQDADLKLGCGIPTEVASISEGDVVVDLGCGAGNDAFVARALVGERGQVIGIDMTEPMIEKARHNADKLGFNNVEFRLGDIEAMPIDSSSVDVVISNCVLNLVPDKAKAFSEMFRILKVGGHFSVSDIVLDRALPPELQHAAEMYAGCVSGAIPRAQYLNLITAAGFTDVSIKLEKPIVLPSAVLLKYLSPTDAQCFQAENPAIVSITVYGLKP